MDMRHFTQFSSKVGLLVFLGGVAAGRLVIGSLTREEKILRNLKFLFGCAALVFLGLYSLDLGEFTYIAIFLSGITISTLLPMIITIAGVLYKDLSGTVIGSIKVAIPIGGILVPFVMSLVARNANLQTSLLVYPLVCALAFVLTITSLRVSLPSGDS
jgi:fucose permease